MVFLLMGFTLLWAWWRHPEARKGLRWITLVFCLSWVGTTGAANFFAAGMLEWQYPPVLVMPDNADAIVLFSSGAYPATEFMPETTPGCGTLRRCRRAARLYHTRPCPIIACGGNVDRKPGGETLAGVMKTALIDMGVKEEDIVLEVSSADTHQNAANAKKLLEENGWSQVVLVTDGTHLYRSELCFRKQKVDVIPASAHYESLRPPERLAAFIPSSYGANKANVVIHEWVGLVWYKLRGRI